MEIPRPRTLQQFSSQRSQLSRRSAAAAMFWHAALRQHTGKTSTETLTGFLPVSRNSTAGLTGLTGAEEADLSGWRARLQQTGGSGVGLVTAADHSRLGLERGSNPFSCNTEVDVYLRLMPQHAALTSISLLWRRSGSVTCAGRRRVRPYVEQGSA